MTMFAFGRAETIVEFIGRVDTATTVQVAGRFGWGVDDALARLKQLERHGKISGTLVRHDGANVYEWRRIWS